MFHVVFRFILVLRGRGLALGSGVGLLRLVLPHKSLPRRFVLLLIVVDDLKNDITALSDGLRLVPDDRVELLVLDLLPDSGHLSEKSDDDALVCVLLGSLGCDLHFEYDLVQYLLLLSGIISANLLLDGFDPLVFDVELNFLLWNHQELVQDHHSAIVLEEFGVELAARHLLLHLHLHQVLTNLSYEYFPRLFPVDLLRFGHGVGVEQHLPEEEGNEGVELLNLLDEYNLLLLADDLEVLDGQDVSDDVLEGLLLSVL